MWDNVLGLDRSSSIASQMRNVWSIDKNKNDVRDLTSVIISELGLYQLGRHLDVWFKLLKEKGLS